MPARKRGGFCRADAAQLRSAQRQRSTAHALPKPLQPHFGGRISRHQQAAIRMAQTYRGRPKRDFCRGRRRPIHLSLSRRKCGQHDRPDARISHRRPHQARTQLSLRGQHSCRRQRRYPKQQRTAGQKPAHRSRKWRQNPLFLRL